MSAAQDGEGPFFDPRFFISPAYLHRDDAVYDELHWAGPSVRSVMGEVVNGWLLLRRRLRSGDAAASTDIRDVLWRGLQGDFPLASALTSSWLVFVHGERHQQLRSLALDIVDGAMREDLRRTFERRWDDVLGRDPAHIDLVSDIVRPSVAAVMSRHCGDEQQIEPHVEILGDLTQILLDMTCRRRDLVRAEEACARVLQNPAGVAAHLGRSCNPTVRALATGSHSGDDLSTFELVALLAFLIGAASETTNVLMAALAWSLADAGTWQRVIDDPSPRLLERVVAESLRLASPIQAIGRTLGTGDDVQPVFFNLAAANRDPDVFACPHALDLTVGDGRRPHVAFGHGAHYCVGAATARELGVAWARRLVAHGRKPVVTGPPRARFRYFLVALESYVVEFEVGM